MSQVITYSDTPSPNKLFRSRDLTVNGKRKISGTPGQKKLKVCIGEIYLALNDMIEVGAVTSQDHFDFELPLTNQIFLSYNALNLLL